LLLFSLFLFLWLAAGPNQASSLLQSGLLHLKQGNLQQAQQDLEASSKADPTNPYTWTSLAETYLRLKQSAEANNAAQKAEKIGAGNPVVAHALAIYYSEIGRYARAAELEKQFAASPQADSGALARAAGLYLNAGNAQQALALAQKANSEHPSAETENLIGRALVAAGQPDEGARHLAAAWSAAKTDAQFSFDYAQALLHAQDFTQAAQVLEDASKANPKNAQLTLALGVARYGQRRFSDAINAFLQTIQLDRRIPHPYLFLGRLLDQARDQLPAITSDYRKWIALEPRRAEPPLLLAKALLAANADPSEPETLLRRSLQLDSKNWETHYELGLLLVKKHDYKQASVELQRSIELDPKQAMPHYHLARVYDRLGERDRAQAERETHHRLTTP
jgi:tetratricopeptide (TPR) repeat protein